MATQRDRKTKKDRPVPTKTQEERDIRNRAHATGQERADMPLEPDRDEAPNAAPDAPERRQPDASHTRDPKPFPTQQDRSGPGRKF